jgi:hypothetical protein
MSFKDLQRALVILGLILIFLFLLTDVPLGEFFAALDPRKGW